MKILLQSTLFYPSVGGIETVSQCLAENYTQLGHVCTVVTRSEPPSSGDRFPFLIVRNPTSEQKKRLILEHDLVHCNGASLELVFLAWKCKKPVVWTHAGYQLISIDGLGWHQGEASPLAPFPSFLFHVKRQGAIRGTMELAKLLLRRFAAQFVHHVAITKWVANRQPFPHQVIIYNPFPIHRFAQLASQPSSEEYDFFFLGRLVSEKGVATLLKAFALFLKSHPTYSKNLLIVGDGNWRAKLEALALELGIERQVDFAGKQTGEELLKWVAKGKFAIIPSEWEEPMGGVALEMLAAGKPVVVSERGGLAECVGDAGLLFPNEDPQALASQMARLYQEKELASLLKKKAEEQIKKFDQKELTQQYIVLFQKILHTTHNSPPTTLKKKVIVSHSGKQYVHQLLFALQKEGYLQLFITSIWYKPSFWFYKALLALPGAGGFLYNKFLKKKTYPEQQESLIEQYPWKEIKRQVLVQISHRYRTEKYVFEVEKAHDRYVAKRLKQLKPNVFIGYEKSSLESFKEVKRQGGITVLDLAQVHYQYLIHLRETQETFQDLFEDKELFDEINRVKQAEYEVADYILTLSQFAKSTLVKYGINESKIKVVNLGYNPTVFRPKPSYPQQATHNGKLKLIYTGTFTRRKGVHLLLQVLEELNNPHIELTIIGPILDGEDLFSQYKGKFTYYDFLHHEEMVKHLHASDVYVFPSFLDSWAMTVVEAMACGLPVIVTENTGAKDAVEHGETGLILPIGEKEALKKAILHFYEQRAEIERMGSKASKAAEQFQWNHYYDQIREFIGSL